MIPIVLYNTASGYVTAFYEQHQIRKTSKLEIGPRYLLDIKAEIDKIFS